MASVSSRVIGDLAFPEVSQRLRDTSILLLPVLVLLTSLFAAAPGVPGAGLGISGAGRLIATESPTRGEK